MCVPVHPCCIVHLLAITFHEQTTGHNLDLQAAVNVFTMFWLVPLGHTH